VTEQDARALAAIVGGEPIRLEVKGNRWATLRRKRDGSIAIIDGVGAELFRSLEDVQNDDIPYKSLVWL
jgi:hypothetical protein